MSGGGPCDITLSNNLPANLIFLSSHTNQQITGPSTWNNPPSIAAYSKGQLRLNDDADMGVNGDIEFLIDGKNAILQMSCFNAGNSYNNFQIQILPSSTEFSLGYWCWSNDYNYTNYCRGSGDYIGVGAFIQGIDSFSSLHSTEEKVLADEL